MTGNENGTEAIFATHTTGLGIPSAETDQLYAPEYIRKSKVPVDDVDHTRPKYPPEGLEKETFARFTGFHSPSRTVTVTGVNALVRSKERSTGSTQTVNCFGSVGCQSIPPSAVPEAESNSGNTYGLSQALTTPSDCGILKEYVKSEGSTLPSLSVCS